MKTTARFENAIQKLYKAFHSDTLHPECCKQCAVGNILDNTDAWKHLSDDHGALELNYIGRVHEALGRKFNGYSPSELLKIEAVFLNACGYQLPLNHRNAKPIINKDSLFSGLCAVIDFLCKIDAIPNPMDYSKLFKQTSLEIVNHIDA